MSKYENPVHDLLTRLETAGFKPRWVDDGGKRFCKNFADHVLGVDESWLNVERNNERFTLFLVIGNGQEEIVADYAYKAGPEHQELEHVLDAFYDHWLPA